MRMLEYASELAVGRQIRQYSQLFILCKVSIRWRSGSDRNVAENEKLSQHRSTVWSVVSTTMLAQLFILWNVSIRWRSRSDRNFAENEKLSQHRSTNTIEYWNNATKEIRLIAQTLLCYIVLMTKLVHWIAYHPPLINSWWLGHLGSEDALFMTRVPVPVQQ